MAAALCLSPLLCASSARAAELQLYTDDSPPVSFPKEDGGPGGWAVDVVTEIQRRLGKSVPIKLVPWARAYYIGLHQPNVAIFAIMRTPTRESLFQWVGPLQTLHMNLYASAASPVELASLDDARRAESIGVVNMFATDQELTGLGFHNLDRSTTPEQMMKKLLAGRISLVASDDGFIRPSVLQEFDLENADVRPVLPIKTTSTYIAFSQGTSAVVVKSWQRALDEMIADGSFARLTAKRDE